MTTRSPDALNKFLLIAYADLKKYKYYYWFAFPAFLAKPAWEVSPAWEPLAAALITATRPSSKGTTNMYTSAVLQSHSPNPTTAITVLTRSL